MFTIVMKLDEDTQLPLIRPDNESERKEAWRIRLRESVTKEILDYCEWAGLKYRDTFIEKACSHIFNEDKEWQVYKARNPTQLIGSEDVKTASGPSNNKKSE